MLRKSPLLICLLLIIPVIAFGQAGFEFEPELTEDFIDASDLGTTYSFHCTLTNTGDAEDIFVLTRSVIELPEGWMGFLCTQNGCFFVDPVNDTLGVDEQDTEVLIDFIPSSLEEAHVRLVITSTNDPEIKDSVDFYLYPEEDVDESGRVINQPNTFKIGQVYPNPFNSFANVRFTLDNPGHTKLAVYTTDGRFVTNILNQQMAAGQHIASFHAGAKLSSGMYLLKLESAGKTAYTKATYLK